MSNEVELEILRSMKRRLELMLEHNVTKIKSKYPEQDGEYEVGYVSAKLLTGLLQRVEQKFENVTSRTPESAEGKQ